MAHITSINVRVDDETKQRIQRIADYREITMSDLVREWYADCIQQEEKIIEEVKKNLGE